MNFIQKNIKDLDQEIIDFVDSDAFKVFERIMERKYLEKLQEFHQTNVVNLEAARAKLNVYLELPTEFEYLKNLVIKQRQEKRQKETISEE